MANDGSKRETKSARGGNKMTDELDKLKNAFDAEPEIKASDRAKKSAMNSAMQAFEKQHESTTVRKEVSEQNLEQQKKSENNFQGNSGHIRQKDEDRKKAGLFNLFDWSNLMKHSYIFPVAAAGALAVSVLVLNPQILQKKDVVTEYLTPQDTNEKIARNTQSKKEVVKNKQANLGQSATKADSVKVERAREEVAVVAVAESEAKIATADGLAAQLQSSAPVAKPSAIQAKKMQRSNARLSKLAPRMPTMVAEVDVQQIPQAQIGRDKFEPIKTNPLKLTEQEPVSTFSVDVDTASYSFMRGSLNQNRLPQKDAVRVEELINYFPYDYAQPEDATQPFKVSTTVMPTPWNANTKLLHIGIKGYELSKQENPKSNLVFLLDTSGSMNQANKLPLLINSFKLLLSTLQDDDTVSIVVYAGSAGTILEPTKVKEKAKIIQALERLRAGGSTAGGQGIRLAYQLAEANYDKDAVNRVLLATDGDFNVGIRSPEELKGFVERKRKSGVFLSVLGFGKGNYNDALMQKLAQSGNGNAAYIDSLSEARKVLVDEASSTLFTIAKDVKIQMEFNPKAVSDYRLIGYETRALKREDFNNDKVDAGDIGAGHTVTAIYEITPTGSEKKSVDPLRYGKDAQSGEATTKTTEMQSEYGFLKLRYKLPNEDKSNLIQTPILIADAASSIDSTSTETRFATSVAAFGQLLRGGKYIESFSYDDIIELAQNAKGKDLFGYRAEFINLVRLAQTAEALR